MIVFDPSVSGTVTVKLLPFRGAVTPLTTTPASARLSFAVPLTTTVPVSASDPSDGLDIVTCGAVLSRLTVALAVALFPALSMPEPVTAWLAPSAVTVTGSVQDSMPLIASEQSKLTVTSVLFQPAKLGVGLTVAVMVGGSLSIPMTSTVITLPGLPFKVRTSWFDESTLTGMERKGAFFFLKTFEPAMIRPFRRISAAVTCGPVAPLPGTPPL